jgi:DNA-binding transcriptional regulator LsrR (DeoR family)
MVLTYDAYNETLEKQQEIADMKKELGDARAAVQGIGDLKRQLDNLRNIVMGVKEKESSSQ